MWWRRKRKRRAKPRSEKSERHYEEHKELARGIIRERTAHWNQFYGFSYKRIAIKNQRTCWGSCSEHGNLNFNYKIVFLPEVLMDYVIVHELCHLAELNHSETFWSHVAKTIPDFKERRARLKKMSRVPAGGFPSSVAHTLDILRTSL